MEDMLVLDAEREFTAVMAEPEVEPARPRLRDAALAFRTQRREESPRCSSGSSALLSLVLGLSMLAALPVVQFLTLGYFLETSARVSRSGRIRDGFVGVRKAARVRGVAAGIWLSLVPTWFAGMYAVLGRVDQPQRRQRDLPALALVVVTVLAMLHIGVSCLRGGRIRYFLWPFGHPVWLWRRLKRRGLYSEARDGLWAFAGSLHLPYYFRLGFIGFFGTLAWLAIPGLLIAATGVAPLLAPIGMLLLAIVVPFLPFLQVRYALEGKVSALFFAGPSGSDSAARLGRSRSRCSRCCSPRFRYIF